MSLFPPVPRSVNSQCLDPTRPRPPSVPHRSRGWSVGACAAASAHAGRHSARDDGVGSVGVVPHSVARGLFAGLSLHVEWITGLLVDGASGGLLPFRAITGRLVHAPASDRGRLDRRSPV